MTAKLRAEPGERVRPSTSAAHVGAMVLFGALLLATVVSRSFDPGSFNHDVGWILYVAEQIQGGRELYVDIIEENPPLIFWLSVPAIGLSQALGTTAILAWNLMVLAWAAVAGCFLYRVVCRGWVEAEGLWGLGLTGLVIAFEVLLPGYEFGQRENLFLIAAMPYLLAAAVRADGRKLEGSLAVCVGLMAGIGFAIKPYFLLFWLLVEVFLLVSDRGAWKRIENACIVFVNGFYLLLVVWWTPDYQEMVVLASQVYDAYAMPFSPLLLWKLAVGWWLVSAVLFFLVRSAPFEQQPRRFLLLGSTAFLVVALVQAKGWDYHYDPVMAASGVLVVLIVQDLLVHTDFLKKVLRFGPAAVGLTLWVLLDVAGASALGQSAWNVIGPGRQQRTLVKDLTLVVNEHAWNQSVWFLSTSVVPAFPVVNLSGARWSSRYCCLWLLPGLYSPQERAARPFVYRDREEMSDLERGLVDAVVEDLATQPPALLLVDRSPDKQVFRRSEFDYLAYFLRDPRFARFFQNYRELGVVGPYQVYTRNLGGS